MLDDFFGEKQEPIATVAKSRTQWSDAPEHLRPLLDTWSDVTGWKFTRDRRFQIKEASHWYDLFGADTHLIRYAFEQHRKDKLKYKSLASIAHVIRNLETNKKEETHDDRQKYLKWTE